MKIRFHFLFFLLFIINSSIFPAPPHPDLLNEIREDKNRAELFYTGLYFKNNKGINVPKKSDIPFIGVINICVILVQFDGTDPPNTPQPAEPMLTSLPNVFFTDLLNGETEDDLSVRKYYFDMSNGQLELNFNVYGPYNIPKTHSYYGEDTGFEGVDAHPTELVFKAVNSAAEDINGPNFSDYAFNGEVPVVVVIHAGRGQESGASSDTIWSHMWILPYVSGSPFVVDGVIVSKYTLQPEYFLNVGDSTIGVFSHELGHIFGLTDLYDTSYVTNGIGDWSLMSTGVWNGPENKGSFPAPLLAWEREILGWINYDELVYPASTIFYNYSDDYYYFLFAGIIFIISLLFVLLYKNKKIIFVLLPAAITICIPISFLKCKDGDGFKCDIPVCSFDSASVIELSAILENIETGFEAKKITLNYNYYGYPQYLIIENKVKTEGEWSEYLPGEGLLITHIDEYVLYGINAYNGNNVNSLTEYGFPFGVGIIEADGNNAMLEGLNYGESTDTFYLGNKNELTPVTNPATYYNEYLDMDFYCPACSSVAITNISAPGSNMTFNYSY